MYLKRIEAENLISQLSSSLLADVQKNFDFLLDLLDADDWSFVIKRHAMIEAAITELLVQHIGDERLRRVMERLPLSDAQAGKLIAARDLELIGEEETKFIRWFSELRNRLAHRLDDVNFTFDAHVKTLDKNQKRNWYSRLTYFAMDKDLELERQWRTIAEENPKIALFMGIGRVVNECAIAANQKKGIRKINEVAEHTTRKLLEPKD